MFAVGAFARVLRRNTRRQQSAALTERPCVGFWDESENGRLRVCSPAEIQTLLGAAAPDLALIARVTLESLLRLSEVLALRREDIGPTFTLVLQSKSGKARPACL
jgi:hypothetical protein